MPAGRLGRVDPQPHLALVAHRLEGGDLLGDELRLALLVVDTALDDHDPVERRRARTPPRRSS